MYCGDGVWLVSTLRFTFRPSWVPNLRRVAAVVLYLIRSWFSFCSYGWIGFHE
ncbi:hypothetical protein A2U01_0059642, partial [Trifolium medium]|nr:hypothetical protein [Trifolium medium]